MEDQAEGSGSRSRRAFVTQVSRKVRACDECRRHKIRCDLKGPDEGLPCVRCARMKLECRLTKSLQSILEQRNVDEDWRQSVEERLHLVLTAVDELSRRQADGHGFPHKRSRTGSENPLGMLADAASDNAVAARVNWNDDVDDAGADPASAPGQYLSHISEEIATRHRPSPSQPRVRTMLDVVDRGLLSLNDAQELVHLYFTKLDPQVCSIVRQAHPNKEQRSLFHTIRQQPLLFLAICSVAALHRPSREREGSAGSQSQAASLFTCLHDEYVRLSAQQSIIREQSLDDIRALLVASWWLRDVSWISTGSAVRLATERGMQEAYKRCSDMQAGKQACRAKTGSGLNVCAPGEAVRQNGDQGRAVAASEREAYEAARLYYLVYVADHQAAIPFARPPMTRQHAAVRNVRAWLAGCRLANEEDARLAAQVELWVIAHDVVDDFGIDVQQALTRIQVTEQVPRFLTLVDRWQARWRHVLRRTTATSDEIDFQAHMMRLFVSAHIFRSPRGIDPLSINADEEQDAGADWAYDDVEQRTPFAQRSLPQLPAATTVQTKDQQAYRYELGRRAVNTAIELIETATRFANRQRGGQSADATMFGQPIYPFSMVVFACLFLHKLSRRRGRKSDQRGRITLPDCSTTATIGRVQRVVDLLQSHIMPFCAADHISATVLPGLTSLLVMERARLGGDGMAVDGAGNDDEAARLEESVTQAPPPNIDELLTLPSSTFDGMAMSSINTSPGTPLFNFDLQSLDLLSDLRYLSGISSDALFWQPPQDTVQFAI